MLKYKPYINQTYKKTDDLYTRMEKKYQEREQKLLDKLNHVVTWQYIASGRQRLLPSSIYHSTWHKKAPASNASVAHG